MTATIHKPAESARWFLHVGVADPGVWDEFIDDADAIAAASIQALVLHESEATSIDGSLLPKSDADTNKYLS
ncbi:hypothetical protein [Phyllobacterium ifriqiyense]|uniref:hypothetical protein n=1 Tax=Phyllobacterium ifriqiyense TaxID=314238 RepID=UPI00339272A9